LTACMEFDVTTLALSRSQSVTASDLIPVSIPSLVVRPYRMGHWACPKCGTINRTLVTVIHGADDEPTVYRVPSRVGCRSVFCDGTFDTLPPT